MSRRLTPAQYADGMREYFGALCDVWPKAVKNGRTDQWIEAVRRWLEIVESDTEGRSCPVLPTDMHDAEELPKSEQK